MRIAYIILAHKLIDQLARLVDVLNDGADTFFVHLDARAERRCPNVWGELEDELKGAADIRPVIPRHRCYWGSLELVLATLEGMRAVIMSGIPYDRVLLLSGQDYPIKRRSYIKSFLAIYPENEFIESFSLSSPNKWSQWPGAGSDMSRVRHWHLRIRSRWLHVPLRRRLPLDVIPHGGSQWWALTLPCVRFINRFVDEHAAFLEYYRHAFIPDEQFFQTIVANSQFASRVVGTNLTYTDSSRPTPPWPVTFTHRDLAALMQSSKLFARKFDQTQDSTILDLLDRRIREPDASGYRGGMPGAITPLGLNAS